MANREFLCRGVWRESGEPAAITVSAANEEAAVIAANNRGVLVDVATDCTPLRMNAGVLVAQIAGCIFLFIGVILFIVAWNMEVTNSGYYNTGLLANRQLVFGFGCFAFLVGVLDLGFISVVAAVRKETVPTTGFKIIGISVLVILCILLILILLQIALDILDAIRQNPSSFLKGLGITAVVAVVVSASWLAVSRIRLRNRQKEEAAFRDINSRIRSSSLPPDEAKP